MKKIILGCSILALMTGYAKIEFTDDLGNKASYYRLGLTDLNNIEYANGEVTLKVGSAKGDSGQLGTALVNTSEAVLNATKIVAPIP